MVFKIIKYLYVFQIWERFVQENDEFFFFVFTFWVTFRGCYETPLKTLVLNPNPQGDGGRRWGRWEVMRSWGWSPHDGISVLIKETPESSCPFLHVRTEREDAIYEPGSGSSPDTESWTSSLQNCEK